MDWYGDDGMKLYFVRHGRANRIAASDELRQLDEEGIQQAQNMGRVLAGMGIKPAAIFSSPRLRALETAQLLGTALGIEPEINNACNFDFTAAAALELAAQFHDNQEIMFVGHNPSMSEVVAEITGARVDLSTGAVACAVRVHPPRAGSALLKWLLTPKTVNNILEE